MTTKAEYFNKKMAEYAAYRKSELNIHGTNEWSEYQDEWYTTDENFFYAGMEEFLGWLEENE